MWSGSGVLMMKGRVPCSPDSPARATRSIEQTRRTRPAADLCVRPGQRWNRFPLNAAFVPWAVETARYLVQGREPRQSFTLPDVPGGVPAEPGMHQVGGRPITVNTDVRESNPAHMSAETFSAGITRTLRRRVRRATAEAREQEEQQRLWQIGLW